MNNTMTYEITAQVEERQRNVARMAEQDAELVAAMAMAYAAGKEAGAASVQQNEK